MFKNLLLSTLFCLMTFSSIAHAETDGAVDEMIINNNGSYNGNSGVSGVMGEPAVGSSTLGPVGLIFDRHFSPYTGAEMATTLLRGYEWLDDKLIPSTTGDTSFSMILGRTGKALVELVLFDFLTTFQHEVFGHGFRAREFGVPVHRYEVTFFSGGTTYLDGFRFNSLSLNEQIAINAGGVEANNIMAKRVRDRWLNTGRMDNREALFYLLNEFEQTYYIGSTKSKSPGINDGHDIFNYVQDINRWFGRPVLTTSQLRRKTRVDYLNPYFFYSLFSIGQYVFDGTQTMEYPMFHIGDYHYLPAMHLVLAPYGTEYNFLNFIRCGERVYQANIRFGETGGQHSYGLALEATKLMTTDLIDLDGKLDVWYQPKMFTFRATNSHKAGAALSMIGHLRFGQSAELIGQLGYKTTGFMLGEELRHSPIMRIGFLVSF